jgi:hypothetical protein
LKGTKLTGFVKFLSMCLIFNMIIFYKSNQFLIKHKQFLKKYGLS